MNIFCGQYSLKMALDIGHGEPKGKWKKIKTIFLLLKIQKKKAQYGAIMVT